MVKLNVYLADLVGAHAKLQNLHWNVVGQFFITVHEYTEEMYREIYEFIDKVAEYMVMNGARPFGTLKDFAENTTVTHLESKEYKAGEAVRYSLGLMRALKKSAHEIHEETECYLLLGLLEEQIANFSKHIWFLDNMIQPNHSE